MPVNVVWIKAPSSVSSVTRRSSSNVPSALAVTQSPPPASTLPRRRSPSKEPPVTGKMASVPCGVLPISSVAEVVRRSSMRGREFMASKASRSENFVNGIDRAFCATVAAGHCDQAIQERVRGVCGLEARRGAKVVGRGIDGLAASDGRDHVRRSVTQAERFHRDERAVVGPERDAKVQLEDAVGAEEEPVRAPTRQDRSAKTGALEVPADQR